MKLAVAAIFKNEKPYIIEWLAFHRIVGVDYFFIADNISDDGSTELLQRLDALGLIKRIAFPTENGKRPQIPAYNQILKDYGSQTDWLAFIDADEFLVPTSDVSLKDVLKPLLKAHEVGAVGINWAVFGSSGLQESSDELVLKRFRNKAKQSRHVNKHIKSIVKTSSCKQMLNPHKAILSKGAYFSAAGKGLEFDEKKQDGLSKDTDWEKLVVNHYVIKSYEEFKKKKQPRGRATTSKMRDEKFFKNHDINDEYCHQIERFLPELVEEIAYIKRRLNDTSANHNDLEKKSQFQKLQGRTKKKVLDYANWLTPKSTYRFIPKSDLVQSEGSLDWKAVGNDPYFRLRKKGLNVSGWQMLTIKLASTSTRMNGKIYIDYGKGFSEEDAIDLPLRAGKALKRVFFFHDDPVNIRFDPADQPCQFSIDQFTFSKLTPSYAKKLIVKKRLLMDSGELVEDELFDYE